MPRFTYNARDRGGSAVSSVLEAPSRKDALRLLAARGLQVTSVSEEYSSKKTAEKAAAAEPKSFSLGLDRPAGGRGGSKIKLSRKQRLPFLQTLYDLTSSGLSAGESVRLLSIRLKEPELRVLCAGLWERLGEGMPLSRAMEEYPAVFDPSTISLIQAGEATGSLRDVLGRLITHLTEQRDLQRQLLTALAYPVLLMMVASGVVMFFLFFLLPRLQSLFDSLGGQIPVSTKILIALAHFALRYGWLVVLALIVGLVSFLGWRRTEPGRAATDDASLKFPVLGPFIVTQTVLAISQTLSILLENGITTAEALRMTERQISNRTHRHAFSDAIGHVLEGESLSLALGRTGCFPDLVIDRLSVGENTGNIVPSLKDIGRDYQKIITTQLNFFTNVLATVLLLSVFAFVGFIAFAIVSAIFKLSGSFKM